MEEMAQYARTGYLNALRKFPQTDDEVVEKLPEYTGIDKATLIAWSLDIAAYDIRGNSLFLTTLLKSKGEALGSYDGRVTGISSGIAGKIDPNSGSNDPDHDSGEWRLHIDVEQLPERAAEVHVDVVVHGPERSGVSQLGLQAHGPDRRAEGR